MLYAGVLILLVIQYVRPQEIPGSPIYAWPVLDYTMAVLLPAWLATLQNKKLLRTPEDMFTFALWVICAVSYVKIRFGPPLGPAWEFGKALLCYLFVAHVVNSRKKLLGALCLLLAVLAFIASLAKMHYHPSGVGEYYCDIGMFAKRNDFADAMVLGIPLCLGFILRGPIALKILGLGVLPVAVHAIVKSEARGAWLAAMFGAYVIFLGLTKSKRGKTIATIAGVVAVIAAFSMSSRLGTVLGYQQDESAMVRIEIWRNAFRSFRVNPILGRGYGRFTDYSYRSKGGHSSYLQTMGDLGLLGLSAYIGLFFYGLRDTWRIANNAQHRGTRMLGLCMAGMIAGHCVSSLTANYSYRVYLLILLAMAGSLRILAAEEASRQLASGQLAPGAEDAAMQLARALPSPGYAFRERGLTTRRELAIIGGLTVGCLVMYKVLVMTS